MLQALRGVSTIVAATIVCELGDLRRFKSASRLMSYVGMVPREYASAPRTWRGSITKAGNPHVRRVLVETCWWGRLRPARPVRLKRRQAGLDQEVIEIAWKAQKRLYDRYWRMRARGKEQDVTIIPWRAWCWALSGRSASRSSTSDPDLRDTRSRSRALEQLEETAEAAEDPSLMEKGTLVVAVWAPRPRKRRVTPDVKSRPLFRRTPAMR